MRRTVRQSWVHGSPVGVAGTEPDACTCTSNFAVLAERLPESTAPAPLGEAMPTNKNQDSRTFHAALSLYLKTNETSFLHGMLIGEMHLLLSIRQLPVRVVWSLQSASKVAGAGSGAKRKAACIDVPCCSGVILRPRVFPRARNITQSSQVASR